MNTKIKQYERDEIFTLLKEVARETPRKPVKNMPDEYGEAWATSVLLERCGISKKRWKLLQAKRPDIQMIVYLQPSVYVKKSRKKYKRLKDDPKTRT